MKIVHIVLGKANPERMNGVNKVVHQLAVTMQQKAVDVEVWGITRTPEAQTPKRSYPLHLFAGSGRNFALDPRLQESIEALPVDCCIHFHGVFVPAFYTIARLLKKQNIPWVVTPHGAYDPRSVKRNYWAKLAYHCLCDAWVLRNAYAVQAITAHEHKTLKQWTGSAPIKIVPNGCLSPELSFQNYCLYQKDRPVFGYMGRLDRQHKGLDLLLQGFHAYKAQNGKGVLWLLGDGPHRTALEKKARELGMAAHVRFWGARFAEEKENILCSMDVFVHTSRWDVLPTACLEAVARGLPIVVSEATGLAEVVKQYRAGYGLTANEPTVIASAFLHCEQAMLNGALKHYGENARVMAIQEFSWDRIVERMQESLYPSEKENCHVAA